MPEAKDGRAALHTQAAGAVCEKRQGAAAGGIARTAAAAGGWVHVFSSLRYSPPPPYRTSSLQATARKCPGNNVNMFLQCTNYIQYDTKSIQIKPFPEISYGIIHDTFLLMDCERLIKIEHINRENT